MTHARSDKDTHENKKLLTALTDSITSPAKAVYVLCLIRKALENEQTPSRYTHLLFYCNWVLHSRIDRTKSIRRLLEDIVVRHNPDDFLTFRSFNAELLAFLKSRNLPTNLVSVRKDNYLFLNLLIEECIESPLRFTIDAVKHELKLLKSGVETKVVNE